MRVSEVLLRVVRVLRCEIPLSRKRLGEFRDIVLARRANRCDESHCIAHLHVEPLQRANLSPLDVEITDKLAPCGSSIDWPK